MGICQGSGAGDRAREGSLDGDNRRCIFAGRRRAVEVGGGRVPGQAGVGHGVVEKVGLRVIVHFQRSGAGGIVGRHFLSAGQGGAEVYLSGERRQGGAHKGEADEAGQDE